ncbi:adenosylcobinamide-GDP ribazoletransferase [Streptacidiphilus monticola]|uniref:Adenosylcobinamide-GDP ribazoletransferase n=1 Tax=Streptacidiphilus monticola TaxID=2161674 RepID=A0ABW1FV75_9ACTN
MRAAAGLRFAFGTLSVLPVRVTRWDRPTAGAAMVSAPVVGLVLGAIAGGVGAAFAVLKAGPLLAAVAVVAVLAALTRGLHLDGLADVADGLGSNKPPATALKIMKASDIGPFGVLVLLLTLLGQVAALQRAFESSTAAGACAGLIAATAGRTALLRGCAVGTPSARPDGLGAMVAGTVRGRFGAASALLATGLLGAAGWLATRQLGCAVGAMAATVVGLAAATALLAHCVRRFGGITGDVLGAMVEVSSVGALVVWAVVTAH